MARVLQRPEGRTLEQEIARLSDLATPEARTEWRRLTGKTVGRGLKGELLARSLADFAKLVERFDARGVSFVSVTQSFNTTTSMGRLIVNVLLSFAQFEREVGAERTRDKIAASKRRAPGWAARCRWATGSRIASC